jgi:hypothetical protein
MPIQRFGATDGGLITYKNTCHGTHGPRRAARCRSVRGREMVYIVEVPLRAALMPISKMPWADAVGTIIPSPITAREGRAAPKAPSTPRRGAASAQPATRAAVARTTDAARRCGDVMHGRRGAVRRRGCSARGRVPREDAFRSVHGVLDRVARSQSGSSSAPPRQRFEKSKRRVTHHATPWA